MCRSLFNDILIKKEGFRFGNPDETISSVCGRNKSVDTLLPLGKSLSKLLNKIEKDHVEKSIELDENII